MRLLHIVNTLNADRGGPSESVRMFVRAHQQIGRQVEVATVDDPQSGYDKLVNCEVHACGPQLSGYGYSQQLVKWLRANYSRFDGVIVNGVWQFHGVAARRILSGKRPYVVFSHGMLDPYFMRRYPLKHIKKLLYWTLQEHRNLNRAQAVCFTSEEEMRVAGIGFPFRKFRGVVVPYGSPGPNGNPDELRLAFQRQFPDLANRQYFLFLGRINPKKGCDLLLEAFAQVAPQGMHLVMAGPDDAGWRPELEMQAAKLRISDRVHWTGMLRGDVKWGAYYSAEAFILPSHQENFGISVADALACGVIPLVSDKVNIATDVEKDGAGLMETDTVDGTRRLIERYLTMSPSARDEMRRQAIVCYEKRYALNGASMAVSNALGLTLNA
jgi:glycosyltransferase involved in cell wall biosynthesis